MIRLRHSTDWYCALDVHIDASRAMPFVWGSHDCCTFAADWVYIVRGTDPMADLRGLDSALACGRALADCGGLLAAVTQRMGEPLPGRFAQVGDVVLVLHGDNQRSMGVCLGPWVAAPGPEGLLMVPITQAEAAWRV